MRKNISKWCSVTTLILLVCFVVKTAIDYGRYSSSLNSAPFELWILANAVYFILPAIIIFCVGVFIKKKA